MLRKVDLQALKRVFAVGSGEWSWEEEYNKLINRDRTKQLIESIRAEGIRVPILLGDDGRVWDGHHRITAATLLGIHEVPVEFSGEVES